MKGRAIPVLPTRDTQRTLAFYQRLGFANAGADEWSNDYLVLRAGEVQNLQVAEHAWVKPEELDGYSLPPADLGVVAKIQSLEL